MPNDKPRFSFVAPLLLIGAVMVAPLAAQYPSEGQGQSRSGPARMGRRPPIDPVVVEGPPAPEQFVAIVSLDDAQKQRYTTLYQNLMASTETERDQLRRAREARRGGEARGDDGGEPRQSRDGMREALRTLEDRQKAFDEALHDFCTKEQLKQYQGWRETRRKEAQARGRGEG